MKQLKKDVTYTFEVSQQELDDIVTALKALGDSDISIALDSRVVDLLDDIRYREAY